MTMLAAEASLRELSEGDLAAMYAGADDGRARAIIAELGRRDQLEAARRKREAVRGEWTDGAYAQMLAAETATNGNLVSRRGVAAGVTDWSLWSGPEATAMAYATGELRNFWDANPRVTVTDYRQQIADGHRMQRDERDRAAYDATPATATAREDTMGIAFDVARGAVRAAEHQARYAQAQQRVAERASQIRGQVQAGTVATRAPAAVVRTREPVDGAETLSYLYSFLRRFAAWGSDAEIVTAALWVAQAHARDGNGMPVWQYCARLGIFGPTGSGKSWKSRLIGKLAPAGEILIEPTKPSFIDLCADQHTVILTEADEAFASAGRNRGILAVVNAGYEPDRTAARKHGGKVVKVPVFGHVVLDGLDSMLQATRQDLRTMISRCIILRSARAPEGYRAPRFDRQARGIAEVLSQRCAQWMAQEVADGIEDIVPELPEGLGNRPASLWEPLFTVALRADQRARERAERDGTGDPGTPWLDAVTDACAHLESGSGLPEVTEDAGSELDRVMAEWDTAGPGAVTE